MRKTRQVAQYVLAACALLTQHACTTVVIHSEGRVRTEHGFGVLTVSMPDADASAIALSGVGITMVPGSVALGWVRWSGVALSARSHEMCMVVDFGDRTGPEEVP